MTTTPQFCEHCGARLPSDASFCEMCGKPINLSPAGQALHTSAQAFHASGQAETVIGHLPAGIEKGKGLFGQPKVSQMNIVITSSRLLILQETEETNDHWVFESERLSEEEERSGLPLRALMDSYDWRNPLWAYFYDTPPDELLADHKENEAIFLSDILSAAVSLEAELDILDLWLSHGATRRLLIYNQAGKAAARFLAQVLGPERVQLKTG